MRLPLSSMLERTSWYSFNDGPVGKARSFEPRLSSPSILLPSESLDGLWHLFAHTFLGIGHYTSTSGLNWIFADMTFSKAKDPFIFREGKSYYMLFEEQSSFAERFRKGDARHKGSRIMISSSEDLYSWSEAEVLLDAWDLGLSAFNVNSHISHPQLVFFEGKYRLYFTSGEIRVFDNGEKVPYALSLAESDTLFGPYRITSNAVIRTEPDSAYRSLSIGTFRMIPCSDAIAAIEASVFYDREEKRSRSALLLLKSEDGENFTFIKKMHETPLSGWSSMMLTSLDLKYLDADSTWYCYYSCLSRNERFHFKEENLGLLLGRVL